MLSIGQFSKVCMVTIKALRYYDRIGLIHPFHINEETGYRYYSEDQIQHMLLINRLKRYGFSLSDIRDIMSDLNADTLIIKLNKQRRILENDISEKNIILNDMLRYAASIERTGDIMSDHNNYRIDIITTDDINVISERNNMSIDDFGKYYGVLYKRCQVEKIVLNGICMAIYHDSEFDPECSDIELALGVQNGSSYDRTIKGAECAVTTHYGSYAGLPEAYGAITKWINDNGYKISTAPYEIYVKTQFDRIPVDEWETRIYFPIKKA